MKRHIGRRCAILLLAFLLAVLPPSALLYRDAVRTDAPVDLPEQKLIALTFDDGPRRSTTTRLLDGLAERGVTATFFLIGCQIADNEDVIRRMDREGHQIGIHTFDHVQLTELNQADFDAQVETTRTLLKDLLGHNDFLLRPPFGKWEEGVRTRANCPMSLWSIDPEDWDDKNTARVVEQVVSQAQDGSIILLHDIYPESVDAALQIVDRLHAKKDLPLGRSFLLVIYANFSM